MQNSMKNKPDQINDLPKAAQAIWIKAFNSVPDSAYEGKANQIAWAMVKKAGYEKDKDGNWKMKESETFRENTTLLEAKNDSGSLWRVVIIQAGKSANNNLYPPQMLEKSAGLFEGVRALSRSDEDHLRDKEKNVRNIVGWFSNVQYENGRIIGDFHVSEAASWLRIMLKDAWEQGKKDLIGFSIVADGRGKLKKTPNGLIREVESIDRVSSVDVVVDPAAGGRILKLVAAQDTANHNTEGLETMEKLLKFLESKCPDLYKKIDPDNVTEDEVMELLSEAVKRPENKPANRQEDNEILAERGFISGPHAPLPAGSNVRISIGPAASGIWSGR